MVLIADALTRLPVFGIRILSASTVAVGEGRNIPIDMLQSLRAPLELLHRCVSGVVTLTDCEVRYFAIRVDKQILSITIAVLLYI